MIGYICNVITCHARNSLPGTWSSARLSTQRLLKLEIYSSFRYALRPLFTALKRAIFLTSTQKYQKVNGHVSVSSSAILSEAASRTKLCNHTLLLLIWSVFSCFSCVPSVCVRQMMHHAHREGSRQCIISIACWPQRTRQTPPAETTQICNCDALFWLSLNACIPEYINAA